MAKRQCLFSLAVYSFFLRGLLFNKILVHAATRTDDEADVSKTIMCRAGWNGSAETPIPKEWMNDGYCDCPFDGKDEPDTNACSGSLSWPGVDTGMSNPSKTESHFVCPQQPGLVLPLSRLHDGICDCCDGSDEDPRHGVGNEQLQNPCIDDCREILRAERERKAKIKTDFLAGSRKREMELEEFRKFRSMKVSEASEMEKKMADLRAQIDDLEGNQILGLKQAYVSSRMETMKDLVTGGPSAIALLSGLQDEELEALIVHVCQIAGEIAKSEKRDDGKSTCLALRVAALDLGLTWSDQENFEGGTTETTFHNSTASEILDVILENALEDSNNLPPLRWKKEGSLPSRGRRRLDELNYDEMMYDDDYPIPMNDDSSTDDLYDHYVEEDREENTESFRENKFVDDIRASLFSITRASFMKESQEILNELDKIMEKNKPHDNEGKNETGKDSETNEAKSSGVEAEKYDENAKGIIDPISYNTLKNNLDEKRRIVETGFQWGASAKFLIGASSFPSRRNILERLLIGTIFYGQIGAVHVWQIFQAVLKEYNVLLQEVDTDAKTACASPWAGSCPPKALDRRTPEASDGAMEYPPSFVLKAAEAFCDEEAAKIGLKGNIACQRTDVEDNIEDYVVSIASLPVEDFRYLFRYEIPTRRNDETDPFQDMFFPISKLPLDVQGLQSLQDKRDAKETEHGNLEKDIRELWKKVGGEDDMAFGRQGEYHSIANQCFEINSNKYVYELCIFGKAKQKDGNSQTHLGSFNEYRYSNEDGMNSRVLMWTDGTKCWNGPKRSATVHVTCGPENKIISANEPDTCRYVFEMESYLACDEDYKARMGI